MPPDSKTILRQKAYKSKCLLDTKSDNNCDTADDYLANSLKSFNPVLRSGSQPTENPPFRSHCLAFSFNRSNLRYTSPWRSDASAVEPVQRPGRFCNFHLQIRNIFHSVLVEERISGMNGISMSSNSSSNTQSNTRSNTRSNSLRPESLALTEPSNTVPSCKRAWMSEQGLCK